MDGFELLPVVFRSAILHGYNSIYGRVVLDVGAGTGDCHSLSTLVFFVH